MNRIILILSCCLVMLWTGSSHAGGNSPAMVKAEKSQFQNIGLWPILNQGRVKPVQTYAKAFLTSIYGRDNFKGQPASQWLSYLIFAPDQAYTEEVFYIPNPDVLYAIGIRPRKGHRYSFLELASGFAEYIEEIKRFNQEDQKNLTPAQRQLIEAYFKSLQYLELSRSFSMVLPLFKVTQQDIADLFAVEIGQELTYLDVYAQKRILLERIEIISQKAEDKITDKDKEWVIFAQLLARLERDQNSKSFRIIPPQWASSTQQWLSPWQVIVQGAGTPQTAELFTQLTKTARFYQTNEVASWHKQMALIGNKMVELAGDTLDMPRYQLEYRYNQIDPLYISLCLYILAFVVLMASGLMWKKILYNVSLGGFFLGGLFHAGGVASRMYIMSRPPVATLYESILFVGLIVVIFAWILERRQKNKIGLLVGAALGAGLHFLARKYAADGDTMGMLVAVLNTNFWLATHVVTITIGYGCCLVAGVLSHVYLIKKWIKPQDKEQLAILARNILAVTLIALFFSSLGTILGGIWADQSWGRFWGWDPKENGALLICLWLIWLLHGRVSGTIKNGSFVVGVAFTNIIVALAWFGVNLLNVGLHSYGFTEGILRNLVLFSGGEIIFIVTLWGLITKRQMLSKGA